MQSIRQMPLEFQEMLENMGVLYRCIDSFEEAVECYNAVKMFRININLFSTETCLQRDESEDNSASSFITMESAGSVTCR